MKADFYPGIGHPVAVDQETLEEIRKGRQRFFWRVLLIGIALGLLVGFVVGIHVKDSGTTIVIPVQEGQSI